jgi:hypothetical protein
VKAGLGAEQWWWFLCWADSLLEVGWAGYGFWWVAFWGWAVVAIWLVELGSRVAWGEPERIDTEGLGTQQLFRHLDLQIGATEPVEPVHLFS